MAGGAVRLGGGVAHSVGRMLTGLLSYLLAETKGVKRKEDHVGRHF